MRAVNQAGMELIKRFEGCRLTAYQDAVGVWTIGYGHTNGVRQGQSITQAQAEAELFCDAQRAANAVQSLVKVPLNDDQFAALVSFTYNLGAGALAHSTLLRELNAGWYTPASLEFLRWDHAGGKVLDGLEKRREAEKALFLSQE